MSETIIRLSHFMFTEKEKILVEHGALQAATFVYSSGVEAIRIRNGSGEVIVLPYQGQQVWSAKFGERNLTMKSMFSQPQLTRDYLSNYGGFILHCGMTAMGVPTESDHHPLHGELPNAPYNEAFLVIGEDELGSYIGLGGRYQHTVAFNHNYLAEPILKLRENATLMHISMTVINLKHTEMEYMYLTHVNFCPVDYGRLVYSAVCKPENCKVRRSVPSHVKTKPGYTEFLDELEKHPEKHNILEPSLAFDPEVVFTIKYLADSEGWAHSMQVHPDGSADYIAHRPEQLDKGVRWICRTADQDAIGIVLPATAEPEGYTAEKAKGNIRILPPGGQFHCDMRIGTLNLKEASLMTDKIRQIID